LFASLKEGYSEWHELEAMKAESEIEATLEPVTPERKQFQTLTLKNEYEQIGLDGSTTTTGARDG